MTRDQPSAAQWLLFVHQLPARPTSLRVRTWRRLQQFGAIAVKQAVYVLPDSPAAREDFEWLKTEIEAAGGQASIFVAGTVDTWSNDALIEEFRRSRDAAYAELAGEAERLLKTRRGGRRGSRSPLSARALQRLRERAAAVERVDFFGSAGRDRVAALIRQLEDRSPGTPRAAASGSTALAGSPRGRLWVTRPRPGVDRMSSAWLIRRFIDPEATFDFVADRDAAPPHAVPFDMFGVELTHRGSGCTFETLCDSFQLTEPSLARIAAIVHDLDLKDGRFTPPEAATIGLVIDGLRLAEADDRKLLAHGMTLFEALYQVYAQDARASSPSVAVARTRRKTRQGRSRATSW